MIIRSLLNLPKTTTNQSSCSRTRGVPKKKLRSVHSKLPVKACRKKVRSKLVTDPKLGRRNVGQVPEQLAKGIGLQVIGRLGQLAAQLLTVVSGLAVIQARR